MVVATKPLLTVQNSYRNLFRGRINVCSLFNGIEKNIVITPIVNFVLSQSKGTNLLKSCLYKAVSKIIHQCIIII